MSKSRFDKEALNKRFGKLAKGETTAMVGVLPYWGGVVQEFDPANAREAFYSDIVSVYPAKKG